MLKSLPLLLFVLSLSSALHAQPKSKVDKLREAVSELCVFPDRKGDAIKVEGEIKAGLPVAIKVVKAELSGKIAYEKWNGISIALDKYKTDPRQCSIEMMKLLIPVVGQAQTATFATTLTFEFDMRPFINKQADRINGVKFTMVGLKRRMDEHTHAAMIAIEGPGEDPVVIDLEEGQTTKLKLAVCPSLVLQATAVKVSEVKGKDGLGPDLPFVGVLKCGLSFRRFCGSTVKISGECVVA